MPLQTILEDDWSDYDNKKIRDQRDARFFACTESWEVDYLKKKIKRHNPILSEDTIQWAIMLCCQELRAPHARKGFVECVSRRLGISTS